MQLTVVIFAGAIALLSAGCTSTVTGTATSDSVAASASGTTESTRLSPSTTAAPPTGEDLGGDVDVDVAVGDCVDVGGTADDATIDTAACGSPQANYLVVGKAPTGDQCAIDVDQYYYETLFGSEQGALCLDVDWQPGGCMELSGLNPVRVDCASPGLDTVRFVSILPGVADVDQCPLPATYGFEKTTRNFTVCVEEL